VSVKSDKWIRRMAAKGMIEPFEPGQVKENGGKKVVSYGTSSYGYDIRCSAEFKIFTNINSTIVDPKEFDAKNWSTTGATSASSRPTPRPGAHRRVFPHPPQRPDHLPRQVDLRPLRHHRQRHPRSRSGRAT
jgi:hypothetical protein